MPLSAIIPAEIFGLLFVFTRVGTIFLLMPIIGESYIPTWARLALAFLVSVLLVPVLGDALPVEPASFMAMLVMLSGEFMIGLFLGLIMRIVVSTLTTAGILISFMSGFSAALMFNPLLQAEGVLHAAMLTLAGIMFIFALDLHHLFFIALADSYVLMPSLPESADMAEMMAQMVTNSFAMGLKLATPIVMIVVLFYTVLGLASRLMPQLHIFFIGLPVQIFISTIAFASTFLYMLITFSEYFIETLELFTV